jgi:excisionase family DNA binding protein
MEMKNMSTPKINPELLAGTALMLRGAYPDLTPSGLLEALENRPKTAAKPPGKMYTIKEFCSLCRLSAPTAFRMIKAGTLKTVLVSQRSRRIPASVVESFLNGTGGVL